MPAKSRVVGVILFAASLAGCDRSSSSIAPPATAPTPVAVAPAAVATTTLTTRPSGSTLVIDGTPVDFPRARLRLQQRDGRIIAWLFSDDPKEAIEDSYKGNSYYLLMPLDAEDAAHVSGLDWRYKAASQERPETQNGIFLQGRKIELIPYDVRVAFFSEGAGMSCHIEGQFLQFTDPQVNVGKAIVVSGRVVAEIEAK